MKSWTIINTLRSATMLAFFMADIIKTWFETGNWVLRVLSIILFLLYMYNENVTNPYRRKTSLLKKWADAISAKLKYLPAVNKWTYFDLLLLVVMGLNIYFAWTQIGGAALRVLSISMVVAYVLLRTIEILTSDKN